MPTNYLSGYALDPGTESGGNGLSGQTPTGNGRSADQIIQDMYRNGLTQEGVDAVYQARGLGTAPRLPANLIGAKRQATKGGAHFYDASGNRVYDQGVKDFTHAFNSQVVDPYREYTVGNYLGLAGLIVGGAGAGLAGAGSAVGGGLGGAGAGAGSGSSGLGVFANGGTAGLAGVGGGNAGALAASGGILGGAGIGGTTAGALGGLSGLANSVSGVGGGAASAGGGSMGWWDTAMDLLPALGSLYNSGQQRDAAGDASRAELAGIMAGIDEQRRQFDLTRTDQMPWLNAGTAALGRLQDPNAFATSPGYQFRRDEGTRDIGNSFAARGGALSGNALRGLTDFNQNMASNEFGNWWNQQAGLAGVGQTSANALGSLGQNSANNVSNLLQAGGNARASGIVDQSNAVTGGLNDLAGWYGNWRKQRGG